MESRIVGLSFRDWIQALKITDTPRGDFIGDVRRDASFPDPASLAELLGYLARRGACDEAHRAARALWRQFERECRT